jgi:16S rRNA C1402 (ribose-2'-O) methylase RsmI
VKPDESVGRVVQTTLDAAAQDGVCTATRDRQQAVRDFVASARSASVGVLVVGGAPEKTAAREPEAALQRVRELADAGISVRDAVRQAAEETGVSRSALYRAFQQARREQD